MIPDRLLLRAEAACRRAVNSWGQEPQLRQAQEEAAELIAAINRLTRCRAGAWDQVVEETADVILCLLQLRSIVGAHSVDELLEKKLIRLEDRLSNSGKRP